MHRVVVIGPDHTYREGLLARLIRRCLRALSRERWYPRYMDWYASRVIAPRARVVTIECAGVAERPMLLGPCDTLRIEMGAAEKVDRAQS